MKYYPRLLIVAIISIFIFAVLNGCGGGGGVNPPDDPNGAIVIDHRCINLNSIPQQYISEAKSELIIAYGHTSHGSQLVSGMTKLDEWKNSSVYDWDENGTGGALRLRDGPFSGASDLGNPDRIAWEGATRTYLNGHPEVNVVVWSWCGQVSSATSAEIAQYLNLMDGLEDDYPNVDFVYMTGHLDGSGLSGNLHQRNEQIRQYCREHGKILYDFADIESYNPDGTYFGDKNPNDNCDYDGGNWATEWQNAHTVNLHYFGTDTDFAHTKAVNGNMKAYAAWWLWARLAGWNGQ